MNKHPASGHTPNPLPGGSGRSKGGTIAGEAPGILKGEDAVEGDVENDAGLGDSGDPDQRRLSKSLRVLSCRI